MGFFLSGEGLYREDASPFGIETYRLPDDTYNELRANPQVLSIVGENGAQRFLPFDPSLISGPGIDADSLEAMLLANGTLAEGESLGNGGNLVARAETYTADDFELRKGKESPFGSLTFNGNLNFDLTSAVNLRLGAGYSTDRDEGRSFTSSLYNRDAYSIADRDSYRLYGTFRQRVSDQAFYQIQGEFQDFQRVSYPNGRRADGSDLLSYGDIDQGERAERGRSAVLRPQQWGLLAAVHRGRGLDAPCRSHRVRSASRGVRTSTVTRSRTTSSTGSLATPPRSSASTSSSSAESLSRRRAASTASAPSVSQALWPMATWSRLLRKAFRTA